MSRLYHSSDGGGVRAFRAQSKVRDPRRDQQLVLPGVAPLDVGVVVRRAVEFEGGHGIALDGRDQNRVERAAACRSSTPHSETSGSDAIQVDDSGRAGSWAAPGARESALRRRAQENFSPAGTGIPTS